MKKALVVVCVLVGALLAGCATGSGSDDELLVFAATSLTDAMAAADAFEEESGIKVEISFGPSRALAQQIARGANPDVYVAAGQPPMDTLVEGGHVDGDAVVRLQSNKIVLITGRDAPEVGGIEGLADAGLERIAMPDPEIAPAGNYTRSALQNPGLWERRRWWSSCKAMRRGRYFAGTGLRRWSRGAPDARYVSMPAY